MSVRLTEKEYESAEKALSGLFLGMPYIPSDDDILKIKRDPEKYAAYLLWFSLNRPDTETEDEKKRRKEVIKLANETIEIEEEGR